MNIELWNVTENAEDLIARAARVCYDSFDKESEAGNERLIKHLINNGHHSVLEHASATFFITGISRACSHQLVRHRLAAYSQRSQRFVNEDGFNVVVPTSVKEKDFTVFLFHELKSIISDGYNKLIELGIKPEDARFLLPNACETRIVMTCNFRQWRHIIEHRGLNSQAQWEIREMAQEICRQLYEQCPLIFKDLYEVL